jgi:hypothetical protein
MALISACAGSSHGADPLTVLNDTQPPELHPYNFPELLVLPMSPLKELDNEIRMEALLCRNLDSALQDSRKPYVFEPTAGERWRAAAAVNLDGACYIIYLDHCRHNLYNIRSTSVAAAAAFCRQQLTCPSRKCMVS